MPERFTRSDIIAISGHRDYPDRAALFRGLDDLRAREYIFGGARGVDSDALEYISKTQPRSVRTVVVPNRVINQPRSSQLIIKRNATRVIELKNTGRDRFMIRNRNMVDRSTHLRAFYDFRGRGGTFNTIQYARQKGKSFDTWPMYRYDERNYMGMSRNEAVDWIKRMKQFKVKLLAIKHLVLRVIDEVVQSSVQALLMEFGYPELRTLEQWWYE